MKILAYVIGSLFFFSGISLTFAQVVTITARVPSQHIDATGQADGANMSTPGTKFKFVRLEQGQVFLADPTGGTIQVDLTATDYVPPLPKPTLMPVVSAPPLLPARLTTAPVPIRPKQLPVTDDKVSEVNQILGVTLFDTNNIWQEAAGDVGKRLGWEQDSISSYRVYDIRPALRLHMEDSDLVGAAPRDPSAQNTPSPNVSVTTDLLGQSLINCLGSHAYCSTLYTRKGKPDFISLIFANNGDIARPTEEINLNEEQMTPIIARDNRAIEKVLTKLLGSSVESDFGPGANSHLAVKRWDWNNTSFLLLHSPGRYVGVILCSIAFADAHEIRSDRNAAAVWTALQSHVKKSHNGDVSIEGIPSVDQGDKGYCVPATWERYLRYLDIPGDMYFFATEGRTDFGGGTECQKIRWALRDYLLGYQTHIDVLEPPVTVATVKKEIDAGRPIMWACFSTQDIEANIYGRAKLRMEGASSQTAWERYLDQLKLDETKLAGIPQDTTAGHMRLIIGYNEATNEINVSDSYKTGENHWMSLEEVVAEDQGDLTVLD